MTRRFFSLDKTTHMAFGIGVSESNYRSAEAVTSSTCVPANHSVTDFAETFLLSYRIQSTKAPDT